MNSFRISSIKVDIISFVSLEQSEESPINNEVAGMKNIKNSKTYIIIVYILKSIVCSIGLTLLFKNTVFTCIKGLTYNDSVSTLWLLWLCTLGSGLLLTYKHHRNRISIIVNTILPVEIYCIIVFGRYFSDYYQVILIITAVLCLILSSLIIFGKIKNKANRFKVILNRIKHSCFCTRSLFAVCMILALPPIFWAFYIDGTLIRGSIDALDINNREEYTIANHIDTVLNLQESKWDTLSRQEKIDTLQTIANIEANYLGLKNELNVALLPLEETTEKVTMACYRDRTHTIVLNSNRFDSWDAHQALKHLCHEARHSYQMNLVSLYNSLSLEQRKLLIFEDTKRFRRNVAEGQSDDFLEYYLSPMEWDSRSYAEAAVKDYDKRINEYINQTNRYNDFS